MMMRLSFLTGLFLMAFLISLAGCGKEASPPQKTVAKTKKAKVGAKKQAPQEKQPAAETIAPKYVYEPAGRRDPFLPLAQIRKPVSESGQPLTPLQKFDLGQFRLIGIIIGRNEPMAMVMAPGGKSYVLKRGIKIGKNAGQVINIREDAVVIEERFYDFAGEYRTSVQEIQLPKRQGV
jgi:type IV pilus assembly protein PilP